MNTAISTYATLLRTAEFDALKDALEKQKDALEDQFDVYNELIELRKELLSTYEEEVNYKNELNKKQQAAQNYLGSLQAKAQEEALRQQEEFIDSVNSFLAEYNKAHHFDAILHFPPGELFNPQLDITNDIIEGLNARYKKAAPAKTDEKETKK